MTGCNSNLNSSDKSVSDESRGIINRNKTMSIPVAREWILTESQVKVGLTMNNLSQTYILSNGVKIQIEASHD